MRERLELSLMPDRLAVCRLDSTDESELRATSGGFSVTRTEEELSLVRAAEAVPSDARAERGWRALRIAGTVDFALTGVLASVLAPLGDAGVSIFAVSTYDTDYVLVREGDVERAVEALAAAGHQVESR